MRHKRLRNCAVLLLGLGLTGLHAQESINAIGGDATSGGGSLSFSVGQVFLQENAEGGQIVSEGVQQPYEISILTSTKDAMDLILLFKAYPNPTADFLTIEFKEFESSIYKFELFDINGKILQKEEIKSCITSIDMSKLVPAIYFVKIKQENKEIKTFKVIKN